MLSCTPAGKESALGRPVANGVDAGSAGAGDPPQSIAHLVDAAAAVAREAIAVMAPGRTPLTYRGLRSLVRRTGSALRALGVGPHHRVALMVSNGPEMAVASIAVAASAACAPLNPGLRAHELEVFLESIDPKALIVHGDAASVATVVARRLRIGVIDLLPDVRAEAGTFSLRGIPPGQATDPASQPADTALLLHTSGTTARPKLVPLTNANLCAAAHAVATTLALRPQDRCLNVMPLFHIHGLVAAVMSTFISGGTVVCPTTFDPHAFFRWLEEFHPTWYTAAPPIHQAILQQAPDHGAAIGRCPLRLIRSCSAPLPTRVLADLERTFGGIVIEAYGMTECSHQICSNPLPPGKRKPGSVGPATGCEIAVVNPAGQPVPAGAAGEIVVRGPAVIAGYVQDPRANAEAFFDGWFRTGDLGHLDRDGYLFLEGRIKEIINRGGEKISPREVEEVLMDHPAVAQAVVFPLPHPILGEDVGAAVVTRTQTPEGDLRAFAAGRLADFKVPARVLNVDRIPQGTTGKLQRAALARAFAGQLRVSFAAPTDGLEQTLATMWARALGADKIGIHDNFFELGGHSLAAARMLADLEALTGRRLPMGALFRTPTISQLAAAVRERGDSRPWPSLVAIQPKGVRPPFFCVHGESGNVLDYHRLAARLGPEQSFYGLQARGLDGLTRPHSSVEAMAAAYLEEVQTIQAKGPYFIGGLGVGGLVAFEMARLLEMSGERIALLALFDTSFKNLPRECFTPPRRLPPVIAQLIEFHWQNVTQLGPCDTRRSVYVRQVAAGMIAHLFPRLARRRTGEAKPGVVAPHAPMDRAGTSRPVPRLVQALRDAGGAVRATTDRIQACHDRAQAAYVPARYKGRITVFLAKQREDFSRTDPRLPWGLVSGGIEIHKVPGANATMAHSIPHVRVLGRELRGCLDRALESCQPSDAGPATINSSDAVPS